MRKHIVPDVIAGQHLVVLSTDDSAFDAAKQMAKYKVKSVLVLKGEKLAGIITVSDLVGRVLARDRDPKTTKLSSVMTKNPTTVEASESPVRALRIMDEGGFWHIPVTDKGGVVGVLSRSDFEGAEFHESEHQWSLWNVR